MDNLLPCPFCGSNDLYVEDDRFVECKTLDCGGRQATFRKDQWQNRVITNSDYQSAYAQFEASLKAERESKSVAASQDIIDILKAAEFIKRFNWRAGRILQPTVNELNVLKNLLEEYERSKA